MKILLAAGLWVLLQLPAAQAANDKGSILLVSDPWPGYIEAPQGGYFVDLARQVFETAGYVVTFRTVPFKRVLKMVEHGEADMAPALYRTSLRGIRFAAQPTAVDSAAILCRSDAIRWDAGARSLQGKHLAWTRGFGYEEPLRQKYGVTVPYTEVDGRQDGLEMLRSKLIDGYMDNTAGLATAASAMKLLPPEYQMHILFSKGLYFGFPDTERGRTLQGIFDQAILQMQKDGRLNQLYQRDVPNGVPLGNVRD